MPGFPATDPVSQARRMVRLARPDPLRPVVVLGPGALGLTLELCRDGFHEVVCGGRIGLPCPHEHSSTVLLGGPATTEELRPLLRDACAVLGGRGRLVARLAGVDQDRTVEALLAECGVRVRTAVYTSAARCWSVTRWSPRWSSPCQPRGRARRRRDMRWRGRRRPARLAGSNRTAGVCA